MNQEARKPQPSMPSKFRWSRSSLATIPFMRQRSEGSVLAPSDRNADVVFCPKGFCALVQSKLSEQTGSLQKLAKLMPEHKS